MTRSTATSTDLPHTMRAWVLQDEATRTIDGMALADVPVPHPDAGQVLVRVHAVGLNPVDYKLVENGGPGTWHYPHVPGLDVAGEIVALGEDVGQELKVGMRVAGHGDLRRDGCFAQFAVEPAYALAPIPDDVSYETAAALLCGAMTAYQAIERKPNLNNVHTALVQGGSGAVGGIAVQLAKRHGIAVFTTCSTRKVDWTRRLEPDAIIDYRREDVDARVRELTGGQGVDLIVDTVGAEESARDLNRLAYNGQLVAIVGVPRSDPGAMFARGLSVAAVNLGGAHASGNPVQQHDLAKIAGELLDMAARKDIDPLIEQVLPFDRLSDGLAMLRDHQVTGKLVVRVD